MATIERVLMQPGVAELVFTMKSCSARWHTEPDNRDDLVKLANECANNLRYVLVEPGMTLQVWSKNGTWYIHDHLDNKDVKLYDLFDDLVSQKTDETMQRMVSNSAKWLAADGSTTEGQKIRAALHEDSQECAEFLEAVGHNVYWSEGSSLWYVDKENLTEAYHKAHSEEIFNAFSTLEMQIDEWNHPDDLVFREYTEKNLEKTITRLQNLGYNVEDISGDKETEIEFQITNYNGKTVSVETAFTDIKDNIAYDTIRAMQENSNTWNAILKSDEYTDEQKKAIQSDLHSSNEAYANTLAKLGPDYQLKFSNSGTWYVGDIGGTTITEKFESDSNYRAYEIVENMIANSHAWNTASDEEREILNYQNTQYAKDLAQYGYTVTYQSGTGWVIVNTKTVKDEDGNDQVTTTYESLYKIHNDQKWSTAYNLVRELFNLDLATNFTTDATTLAEIETQKRQLIIELSKYDVDVTQGENGNYYMNGNPATSLFAEYNVYSNDEVAQIIQQMRTNSENWVASDNAEERAELVKANENYAKELKEKYGINLVKVNGDWRIDSKDGEGLYSKYEVYSNEQITNIVKQMYENVLKIAASTSSSQKQYYTNLNNKLAESLKTYGMTVEKKGSTYYITGMKSHKFFINDEGHSDWEITDAEYVGKALFSAFSVVAAINYDESTKEAVREKNIQAIIREMYTNSQAWHYANDDRRKKLLARNEYLAKLLLNLEPPLNVVKGSDGTWYVDVVGGTRLYDLYAEYAKEVGFTDIIAASDSYKSEPEISNYYIGDNTVDKDMNVLGSGDMKLSYAAQTTSYVDEEGVIQQSGKGVEIEIGKPQTILTSNLILPKNSPKIDDEGNFKEYNIIYHERMNRYGWIDPFDHDAITREYLFFTKPDLNFCLGSTIDLSTTGSDGKFLNIESGVQDNAYIMDVMARQPHIISELQLSLDNDNSKTPFMFLLSNHCTSKLELPSISADSQDITSNIMGTTIMYRSHSLKSDSGYDFSLSFRDTQYLEIYNMVKVYDEYMRLIRTGQAQPKHEYIINHIIPEQFSIYKFLVGSDGETILYFAKLTGCYFTDVPRGDFGDPDPVLKYSISFHAQFVEDSNPHILTEFNRVSATYIPESTLRAALDNEDERKNRENYRVDKDKAYFEDIFAPAYNKEVGSAVLVNNEWGRWPYIIKRGTNDPVYAKRVARRGFKYDYFLKWINKQ